MTVPVRRERSCSCDSTSMRLTASNGATALVDDADASDAAAAESMSAVEVVVNGPQSTVSAVGVDAARICGEDDNGDDDEVVRDERNGAGAFAPGRRRKALGGVCFKQSSTTSRNPFPAARHSGVALKLLRSKTSALYSANGCVIRGKNQGPNHSFGERFHNQIETQQ
jgi:hypothetical protein